MSDGNRVAISPDNIAINQRLTTTFGASPSITQVVSDDRSFSIDIATVRNCPEDGVCSSSTIGLSDIGLFHPDGSPFNELRLELVAAYHQRFDKMKNLLFYISYVIKTEKWLPKYDIFFSNILLKFGFDGPVKHICFQQPYLWNGLESLNLSEKKVAWLYAVPVTDAERSIIEKSDFGELDDIFDEKSVDIFDISRKSAV